MGSLATTTEFMTYGPDSVSETIRTIVPIAEGLCVSLVGGVAQTGATIRGIARQTVDTGEDLLIFTAGTTVIAKLGGTVSIGDPLVIADASGQLVVHPGGATTHYVFARAVVAGAVNEFAHVSITHEGLTTI